MALIRSSRVRLLVGAVLMGTRCGWSWRRSPGRAAVAAGSAKPLLGSGGNAYRVVARRRGDRPPPGSSPASGDRPVSSS